MEYIYTCGCADTDSFGADAFRILFPGHDLPSIRHLGEMTKDFAENTTARRQLRALQQSKAKFAYYMKADGPEGLECWDLLKGVRIA